MVAQVLNRNHWLMRAEHARMTASWMNDPAARHILIEIAERYERLAEMPEAYTMGRFGPGKADRAGLL